MTLVGQVPLSARTSPYRPFTPSLYDRVYRVRGNLERQSFDRNYVERLIRGDAETERHFTSYFGDLLLIKLRGRLRSPQLVEDARQETFLRVLNVLRNKGGLEYPERLGAFVNAVCENVLLETFRSSARLQQLPEDASEPVDLAASAESEFVSAERKTLVRSCFERTVGHRSPDSSAVIS